MDSLLLKHLSLIRRLRREHSTVTVAEIKLFFDNIVSYIKNLIYKNEKNDCLDLLTIICDDLASVHTLRLFGNSFLINHPIFIYIRRTLEMFLVKSNHLQSIPMTKCEENCFYTISYLISQLCLYRNETIESFYGSISNETFPITDKINIRDETINENSRKSNLIANKPNLKVTCLSPNVSKSRPIEEIEFDITKVPQKRKFPVQMISSPIKTIVEPATLSLLSSDLPLKKYQEIFLTKIFLTKLIRAIDDLSQNEYSPYHVKYKVIDRLVRLCSKLNIIDTLIDPIVKCLCSKFYQQIFTTIESEQFRLNPKQLFFIYQCSHFIIQHEFPQQEQIINLLCPTMIHVTKSIIENILPMDGDELDSTYYYDRGIALHALSCHLELLNHFSLTSSGRRYFIQSNIIDQMMNILQHNCLIDNACENQELFHADVSIIAYSCMLLYNLAYEKQIFSILKQKYLQNIFSKLQSSKDNTLQFVYKTLSTILSHDDIDEENEPMKLKKAYAEYFEKIIIESKHKITLSVLKNIKERDDNVKLKFLNETYLTNLSRDIEHLSTTKYPSNALKYKNVARRVRVVAKQETKEVESLLDSVLQCLNSKFYLEVFEKIDLNKTKVTSRATLTNCGLAEKHIFFMRECPEFLFRHDYEQRKDIANSLGKKMLEYTKTIFEQHLSILIGDEGKENVDETKAARMAALSYHIKILNHFSLIRSIRSEFLSLPIINQILLILQDQSLIDSNGRIADAKIEVVEQALILLYNLGMNNEILSMLRTKDIFNICLKLRLSKDKIIHFMSHFLLIMLNTSVYDDIYDPHLLSKTCIEYIDKSVKEPRQLYQGIKLHRLLKHLEIIVQNDTFNESLAEEKEGISVITKCICVKTLDEKNSDDQKQEIFKKIQQSAVFIIWKLSFYGPTTSTKLKSNDLFIEQILMLLNGSSKKSIQHAKAIIWRLGSEEMIRLEQIHKKKHQRQNQEDITGDDQFLSTDEWDESIPYDVVISYSNNVHDKILTIKIYNRLLSRGYRVYSEKQGKHRLELMKKAIGKRKPILACLSSAYRASKVCMAEVEYANKNSSPIIPVIVEVKYKIQGWLKHIIGGKNPIDLTQKNFNDELLEVLEEIEKTKSLD
ncbi:unnamed protein product [Rotaria sordida]|uniref:TIR domain-containing protein n=1 Tax=Rotaria sordida TaxID=392033 RepID=A0A815IML8_9BILA|nr:unnamed protein product [Rotaria sordida]